MELAGLFDLGVSFRPATKEDWKGRETKPELGNQYWYQAVELFEDNHLSNNKSAINNTNIALLGYACDEGVGRNQGRIGAKYGPGKLREQLAKLAFHHDEKRITDFGDVLCFDGNMEACQDGLASVVAQLIPNDVFPIVIGGGHDVAYGHLKGIIEAIGNTEKKKIGIVNFDAHFDLRPVENKPNSGTPFAQIFSEYNSSVEYFAIGIQQPANTKELFGIAKENNVEYVLNYDCDVKNTKTLLAHLDSFIDRNDALYITIDMDGFSSAYAPGVSAPSPMGFTPFFVFDILKYLMETKKVISCDIAELNPEFDIDNCTAKLAARIVDLIVNYK
ncbi:MAG: formimidoylglutamase [Flavobacteriales bacterium]|nr:formimidoylglutamase [Flavobacteriales bacterium]